MCHAIVRVYSFLSILAVWFISFPAAGFEIEKISLPEQTAIDGKILYLNGAGWKKRGPVKVDVDALYLEARQSTVDGVLNQPGYKRITMTMLQDLSGDAAARLFVSDFRQVVSDAEFKGSISVAATLGSVFGRFQTIRKGSVAKIDWIPGRGIAISLNDQQLMFNNADAYFHDELAYKIILRMMLEKSAAVSEELQKNMLGLSTSMQQ